MTFKRDYNKYLVLKQDDIRKFLHPNDGEKLEEILEIIGSGRKADGKKDNAYVVVNEDEPYAEIVWKLIEISQANPKDFPTLLRNLETELTRF